MSYRLPLSHILFALAAGATCGAQLEVDQVTLTPEGASVSYSGDAGSYYMLERSADLSGFDEVVDMELGSDGDSILSDAFLALDAAGYYRIASVRRDFPLDVDGDGIDDVFELENPGVLDPFDPADADLDPDGDQRTNLEEYRDRTDPAVADNRATEIRETSPFDGERMVNVTREIIVRFNGEIDPAGVGQGAVVVSAAGTAVEGRLVVSTTKRFLTFFYDSPLPPSSQVLVTIDGDSVVDGYGKPLDADGDGSPGGDRTLRFRTLPLERIPGTDVSGFVRDSLSGDPIEGVTLRIDGFPEADVVSDASGRFEIVDAPAPEFFVHIDGTTALSPPAGSVYPNVGKRFESAPGRSIPLSHHGIPFDIFLPPVATADAVALDPGETTQVGFGAAGRSTLSSMFPGVDPAMFEEVVVSIAPGAARDDFGVAATTATVVPVPPDRLPGPLPEGLNPSLVISIQTPGATNFDVPAAVRFPNVDGLPPGSKATLWSFDHDAGAWHPTGNMTVSADGMYLETDPGVGVLAPGWHSSSPPRNWGGGSEPQLFTSPAEVEIIFTRAGDEHTIELPFYPPSAATSATGREHERTSPQETVLITVEGDLDGFYDVSGADGLKTENIFLSPGDGIERRRAVLRSTPEIFANANESGKPFNGDVLLGAKVHIKTRSRASNGNLTIKEETKLIYHFLDNSDDDREDGKLLFRDIQSGGTFKSKRKILNMVTGGPKPELLIQDAASNPQFAIAADGEDWQVEFDPEDTGFHFADLGARVELDGTPYALPDFGEMEARGTEPVTIYFDRDRFIETWIRRVMEEEDIFSPTFRLIASNRYEDIKGRLADRWAEIGGGADTVVTIDDAAAGPARRQVKIIWSFAVTEYDDLNGDGMPTPGTEVADTDGDGRYAVIPGEFIDFNDNGEADEGEYDPDNIVRLNPGNELDIPGEFIDVNGDGVFNQGVPFGLSGDLDFDSDLFLGRLVDEAELFSLGKAQWIYILDQAFENEDAGEFRVFLPNIVDAFIGEENLDVEEAIHNVVAHEVAHTWGLVHSDRMSVGIFDMMHHAFTTDNIRQIVWTDTAKMAVRAALDLEVDEDAFVQHTLQSYRYGALNRHKSPPDNPFEQLSGIDETPAMAALLSVPDARPLAPLEPIPAVLADGAGGASGGFQFVIQGAGGQPLMVEGVGFAAPGGGFSVISRPPPFELGPGDEEPMMIVFDPTVAGAESNTLIIDTNSDDTFPADTDGVIRIDFSSAGLAADPTFELALAGGSSNLGGVELDQPPHEFPLFTITNEGGAELVFEAAITEGPLDFGIPPGPHTLAPTETLALPLLFAPTGPGLIRGTVTFTTNDPAAPTIAQRVIGTGLPLGGVGSGDFDWGDDFLAVQTGGFVQRRTTGDTGAFSVDIAADSAYQASYFDPQTGFFGAGTGTAGGPAGFTDLTGGLFIRASEGVDTDGDGLPDEVELTIGTSVNSADTDGDGLDDYLEVRQGLNPADGVAPQVGTVGSTQVRDLAFRVAAATFRDGGGETDLAFALTVEPGLSTVDVSDPALPIVISEIALPEDGEEIAVDAENRLVVISSSSGGLMVVDVSDPADPVVAARAPMATDPHLAVGAGMIFTAAESRMRAYDIFTGSPLYEMEADSRILDLGVAGDRLYLQRANALDVYLLDNPLAPALAGTAASSENPATGEFFAATDQVARIASRGIWITDVSEPGSPEFIEGEFLDAPGVGLALNGSGLALMAGIFFTVVDISDPEAPVAARIIGSAALSRDVAIVDGLAVVVGKDSLVSDTSWVRTVNVLEFDGAGAAPQIEATLRVADGDPAAPGLQVFEGASVPIDLRVTDDFQVTRVELLEDGVVAQVDTSYPFTFDHFIPPGVGSYRLQVRASDSGFNQSLSPAFEFDVVPDTFAPTLVSTSPADGQSTSAPAAIDITFDERLAPPGPDPSGFDLVDLSTGLMQPIESIRLGSSGRRVVVTPAGFLAPGEYRLTVAGARLADVAGNPFAPAISLQFTVAQPSLSVSAESGAPTDPGAPSANVGQRFTVQVPEVDPDAARMLWQILDSEGSPSAEHGEPVAIDRASQTATFEVPASATTGDATFFTGLGGEMLTLRQWDVTDGSVRLLGRDSQGGTTTDPYPGNGVYACFNPTEEPGGVMETSSTISFQPGTYRIEIDVAGSQEGFGFESPLGLRIGDLLDQRIDILDFAPRQTFSFEFSVPSIQDARVQVRNDTEITGFPSAIFDDIRIIRLADSSVLFEEDFSMDFAETVPLQIVPTISSADVLDHGADFGGNRVEIGGSGFVEGGTTVNFGGVAISDAGLLDPAFDVGAENSTLAIDPVPAAAETGPITIRTAGGTSEALLASVDIVEPDPASPGQEVTLSGAGLSLQTDIFFSRAGTGPRPVNPISASSDGTTALVQVPADAVTGPVVPLGGVGENSPTLTIE